MLDKKYAKPRFNYLLCFSLLRITRLHGHFSSGHLNSCHQNKLLPSQLYNLIRILFQREGERGSFQLDVLIVIINKDKKRTEGTENLLINNCIGLENRAFLDEKLKLKRHYFCNHQ